MQLTINDKESKIGWIIMINGERDFSLAFKRLLPNITTMNWESLLRRIEKSNKDVILFDLKRCTNLQKFLWQDLRLKELHLKKLSLIPFCALGFRKVRNFLYEPQNVVFNHLEFGYLYLSKPLRIYEFLRGLQSLGRYTFPDIERFKLHIKEFAETKGIIISLIHNLNEESNKNTLQETFLKISSIVGYDTRKEIERCKKNNFPKGEVKRLIKTLTEL